MQATNGTYTIEGKKGQTIWEIALQEYGSVEGVRMLMQDNHEWYIGLIIMPAVYVENLTLRYGNVISPDVKKFFEKRPPGNSSTLIQVGGVPENKYSYNFE